MTHSVIRLTNNSPLNISCNKMSTYRRDSCVILSPSDELQSDEMIIKIRHFMKVKWCWVDYE